MIGSQIAQNVTRSAHHRWTFPQRVCDYKSLHLEMLGVEVVMSPGHAVDRLARPDRGLLPVTVDYLEDGLQIHPNKEFDPDWQVRFKGKLIPVGDVIILSEHE